MSQIRLSYKFAIRDRKTNLFWDGGHCPPYFGVNFRGDPTIGMYTKESENWKMNWAEEPVLFDNELQTKKLVLRYLIDAESFPNMCLSSDIEIVKFQTTCAKNYLVSDEISIVPYIIDKQEFLTTKIHLCFGSVFHDAYIDLLSSDDNTSYQYACGTKKHIGRYIKSGQNLFKYAYHRRVLFLKNADDLMLAKMLVSDGFTKTMNLLSFGPSFMDEDSDDYFQEGI